MLPMSQGPSSFKTAARHWLALPIVALMMAAVAPASAAALAAPAASADLNATDISKGMGLK